VSFTAEAQNAERSAGERRRKIARRIKESFVVGPHAMLSEPRDDFDQPDDVAIELGEFICWHPKLCMRRTARPSARIARGKTRLKSGSESQIQIHSLARSNRERSAWRTPRSSPDRRWVALAAEAETLFQPESLDESEFLWSYRPIEGQQFHGTP